MSHYAALRLAKAIAVLSLGMHSLAWGDEIETQVNRANASAGGFGAGAAAVVTVMVRSFTLPAANLGTSVGNGTGVINLPGGWTLYTLSAPAGGCALAPTQFSNIGGGLYNIRVVPATFPQNCVWKKGDYIYAVSINVGDTSPFNHQHTGNALATLTIP